MRTASGTKTPSAESLKGKNSNYVNTVQPCYLPLRHLEAERTFRRYDTSFGTKIAVLAKIHAQPQRYGYTRARMPQITTYLYHARLLHIINRQALYHLLTVLSFKVDVGLCQND